MAIIPQKEQLKRLETTGFRNMLFPFTQDESGIMALKGTIGSDNVIGRDGMYILEILNNLIQTNGKQNLYQRLPQEVFGGLSEGGRRNVQASLICRADGGADGQEQDRVAASGYSRIQEVIGQWAEKDGCWADTPEEDLVSGGYRHRPQDGGSEARIFKKGGDPNLIKTISGTHFSSMAAMLDRITIHNATFPETRMRVLGFGIREDAIDNSGFVFIISQKFVSGVVPTPAQMQEGMEARGYDRSDSGYYYVSRLDNTVLSDVNENNAVLSPEGYILVYDCDAFLKTFPVNKAENPEVFPIDELLPGPSGRYDSERWKKLLGAEYDSTGDNERSALLKELRLTGKVRRSVDGKAVYMENPEPKMKTASDGSTVTYYDGNVVAGTPRSFKKEHTYAIPEIRSDEASVREINSVIRAILPHSVDAYEFFHTPKWIGQAASAHRGGADIRHAWKEELRTLGRIRGLVGGRWFVQADPEDKGRLLVSDEKSVRFLLWTNSEGRYDGGRLTPDEMQHLSEGKSVKRGDMEVFFNIDKGRIDQKVNRALKLALKTSARHAPGGNRM